MRREMVNPRSDVPLRVYAAGSARVTLVGSLVQAAREISAARQVVWRLFLRDFLGQFRQRILGYAWAFLGPLLGIASFVFLNYAGVLRPGELTIPYPLYVYFGTNLWGLMVGAVGLISGALLAHGDLILRTSIPKMALAVASTAGLIYGQIVNLVVLFVILAVFGVAPSWGALALPLMLLPVMAVGVGIGLFLAVVGAVARDVTNVVTTLLGLMMYITPVVYVPRFANRRLQAVVDYNPFTYLVDEPRNVFFRGAIEHPLGFAAASAFALLVLILGVHGFYLIQDKVAERL